MGDTRIAFKKGKFVRTRKGDFVKKLASRIFDEIKPFSKRREIVGSIRRKEKNPVDIDIVVIPKNEENRLRLIRLLSAKGKFLQGGERRSTFKIEGVKVEVYYADENDWGAMLMSYTGPFGAEIGLRIIARKKGLLLNQYGVFERKSYKKFGIKGKRIAGKTEEEVYHALGKEWKKPELR